MSMVKKAIRGALVLTLTAATVAFAADTKPVASSSASNVPSQQARAWWAYQPLAAVEAPTVQKQNKKWVRTPIDAFVVAKLEENNLTPSPDADRAAFIRRATLDVWGLIPTPEEVDAFVSDRSPKAYEKLVDRLLASPRYGERQARRWLDLARYADSSGFQNDHTRANLWRYRDWVINAFNNDKPYDQFIKEQLAGDELYPNDKNAQIATGFIANYPDNYNSRDLVGRRYGIVTDVTDAVGTVFLAQTIECARCHNHKNDRVSAKEYFQLQSFFANISEDNKIPADVGAQEIAFKEQMAKWEAATKAIRDEQKAILDSVRAEGEKYYKERYLEDSIPYVFAPQDQLDPLGRWVQHRVSYVMGQGVVAEYLKDTVENPKFAAYNPANAEKHKRYQELAKLLKEFAGLRPKTGSVNITAITELGHSQTPKTYLLAGGDHTKPQEEVQPGVPTAFNPWGGKIDVVPTATSSGRRTALANWIADPRNGLTARVYVNRVWAQYFGKGIVETVSDFGRAGTKPANPELLDYLAAGFVKSGWDIKQLHRGILLSSVYRQSSDYREGIREADPKEQLLAVFPRRRLDAEQIRDSLLVASGKLVDKVGGPSVLPPLPKGVDESGRGGDWEVSTNTEDYNRRSLYVFVKRTLPYPLLETFDMAGAQSVHSKREVTTSSLQALNLINDELVYQWSKELAGRVIDTAGRSEKARLDRLYKILFSRQPDQFERNSALAFLDDQSKLIESKLAESEAKQPSEGVVKVSLRTESPSGVDHAKLARLAAFVDLAHTLANSNEFVYRY
jgi:hypothetical protein